MHDEPDATKLAPLGLGTDPGTRALIALESFRDPLAAVGSLKPVAGRRCLPGPRATLRRSDRRGGQQRRVGTTRGAKRGPFVLQGDRRELRRRMDVFALRE